MTKNRLIYDEDYNIVDSLTGVKLDDTQIGILCNQLYREKVELQKENYGNLEGLEIYKELYLELSEKLSNLEADYVELNDKKERWKSMCLSSSNENSILWNEISILREQGAEPSDAFKRYLENILTDYDNFWRKKLEQAKKSGLI